MDVYDNIADNDSKNFVRDEDTQEHNFANNRDKSGIDSLTLHGTPLLLKVARRVTRYREAQGSSPWLS